MNSIERSHKLRIALLKFEALSSSELCDLLRMSQPTFSRLVDSMKSDVLTIGVGRSRKYSLRRDLNYFPTSSRIQTLPVYQVDERGNAKTVAMLNAISERSFYVDARDSSYISKIYPDLPYWLNDLRPSGFLGRLIPRKHPELGYPEDIRLWNADCCLAYWAILGWDLIGNLIVGERAFELFMKFRDASPNVVSSKSKLNDYKKLALETLQLGVAGSSAAGEQPKFLAKIEDNSRSVLVKFAMYGKDKLSQRRKDLLICEYHSLNILRDFGLDCPNVDLIMDSGNVFLEVERFDRINSGGRRGLISLSSVDLEFAGSLGSWKDIALGLLKEKKINQSLCDEILYRYYLGICIGNTDMHSGNLSFYLDGENILGLAPIYDMLPMVFSPVQEQVLDLKFSPPVLDPTDRSIWLNVIEPSIKFWKAIENEARLRLEIRKMAKSWIRHLEGLD